MNKYWVKINCGQIFSFTGGGTPSKKVKEYWSGDIPWASIKDLNCDYLYNTNDNITELGLKNSASKIASADQLILATRINPGNISLAKLDVAINQDLKIIEFDANLEKLFVLYGFKYLKREILKLSSGTTVLGINLNNLRSIEFPLAPLPEQRAIVAKIEELFSDLDYGVESLKKAKQQLEVYRQAVLKKAFEGELTKERNYKNLGQKWQIKSISDIGQIVTGNTPPKKKKEYYSSSDYNFYKPGDLEAKDNVSHSKDSLSKLGCEAGRYAPKGSILVTCIGATIGKTGLLAKAGCFNQQINGIIPYDQMNPKFIYYQAISSEFQDQIISNASSTTLPILNKGKFSKLKMSICSRAEQDKVVEEIESRLSVCDNVLSTIEENLEKTEALRQSILKKAFAGKLLTETELEACRQEADWEPAEELLKKIKEEKAVS
jgi:restriction endonuclease S subunit